jgi:hypothetical protein
MVATQRHDAAASALRIASSCLGFHGLLTASMTSTSAIAPGRPDGIPHFHTQQQHVFAPQLCAANLESDRSALLVVSGKFLENGMQYEDLRKNFSNSVYLTPN